MMGPSTVDVLCLPGALLAYYLLMWLVAGRGPKPGSIVAQYAPPANVSPAEARYALTGTIDYKTVTAVLAHLAAHKVISITPENGAYRVACLIDEPPSDSLPEEAAAFRAMVEIESFPNPADTKHNEHPKSFLLRSGHNDNNISLLASVISGALTKRVQGVYYDGNLRYSLPATAASVAIALMMALRFPTRDGIAFETIWFLFCGLLVSLLMAASVAPALRDAVRGRLSLRQAAIALVPLALFGWALVFVGTKIAQGSNSRFAGALVAVVLLNAVFIALLRKMTPLGRQRRQQLLGFRQFLGTVELDRLNRVNDPRLTPALLNDYLAYAIALDLKESWGDHLGSALFATSTASSG
jgi:Predicted membrane protein (DUF2207) C-terminal domain